MNIGFGHPHKVWDLTLEIFMKGYGYKTLSINCMKIEEKRIHVV